MNKTDKEVVLTLVKAGRKSLARAYLRELKGSTRSSVTTAKTFTAKDLNAMPARTTIVTDDGQLWKHPKGHWIAENYSGGRAEPSLTEVLEQVNKSRHQEVRSNTKETHVNKTDKEVIATLVKEGRKDLARAYLKNVTAKGDPSKVMKVALNNAKMTLDGLAHRDPGYKPLVKKLAALSTEILKTMSDRG